MKFGSTPSLPWMWREGSLRARFENCEDPADVGAVVPQSFAAGAAFCLLHLLEPEVEQVLHGVVRCEGAIAERTSMFDEECLEIGPRFGLGLAVLSVLTHNSVDVAVAGACLPRPARRFLQLISP